MLPSEPDGLVQGERAVPRLRSDLRNSTAAGHTSGQDQICVGDIFFHEWVCGMRRNLIAPAPSRSSIRNVSTCHGAVGLHAGATNLEGTRIPQGFIEHELGQH